MFSSLHATCGPQPHLASLRKPLLFLALSAALLLVIGQYTDIDLWLADIPFDQAKDPFPRDQTWFGHTFTHIWVKNVLSWSGFLLVAAAVLDFVPSAAGTERGQARPAAIAGAGRNLRPQAGISVRTCCGRRG